MRPQKLQKLPVKVDQELKAKQRDSVPLRFPEIELAQSAGTVEYTDCISAEG